MIYKLYAGPLLFDPVFCVWISRVLISVGMHCLPACEVDFRSFAGNDRILAMTEEICNDLRYRDHYVAAEFPDLLPLLDLLLDEGYISTEERGKFG